jgi:hypothetical protein
VHVSNQDISFQYVPKVRQGTVKSGRDALTSVICLFCLRFEGSELSPFFHPDLKERPGI